MEFAENLALDHKYDKELGHRLKAEPSRQGYHYTNAKKLNVLGPDEEPQVRMNKIFLQPISGVHFVILVFCSKSPK